MQAMRFHSIARCWSDPASDIHCVRHGFKVRGIDAATDAALVVKLEFVRDRASFERKSDPVGFPHLAVNTNASIAAALAAAQCPKPN